jgi:hypothetical protein
MNKKWLLIIGLAMLAVPVFTLGGCYALEGQKALSALDINLNNMKNAEYWG